MQNIQLRRGTTASNDNYLGRMGTLSVDIDQGTLRIHDGITVGGHAVVKDSTMVSLQSQLDSLGLSNIASLEIALAAKASVDLIDANGGIATLGPDGKLPVNRLPSFVDDIEEAATLSALPPIGELGKLYIVLDTGYLYRYNTEYVRIAIKAEQTDDLAEGMINLYYTEERVREALSASGEVTFDSETGVFDFSESVNSVNGEDGEVVLDAGDLSLGNVSDHAPASISELLKLDTMEAYMLPNSMREMLTNISIVEEEAQWNVESGKLKSIFGPGVNTLTKGTEELGLYEEVPSVGETFDDHLISATELATVMGLNPIGLDAIGTELVSEPDWMKVHHAGRVLFIAKQLVRGDMTWADYDQHGLFDDDKYIVIGDNVYKVRMLSTLVDGIPITRHSYASADHVDSEYSRIMYALHSGAHLNSNNNPINELDVVGSLASYGDADLQTRGYGHEVTANDDPSGLIHMRGQNGVSYIRVDTKTSNSLLKWRPVLELISSSYAIIPLLNQRLLASSELSPTASHARLDGLEITEMSMASTSVIEPLEHLESSVGAVTGHLYDTVIPGYSGSLVAVEHEGFKLTMSAPSTTDLDFGGVAVTTLDPIVSPAILPLVNESNEGYLYSTGITTYHEDVALEAGTNETLYNHLSIDEVAGAKIAVMDLALPLANASVNIGYLYSTEEFVYGTVKGVWSNSHSTTKLTAISAVTPNIVGRINTIDLESPVAIATVI